MNSLRIFHPSAKEWMKRGFKDFFAVYVGLGLCTISTLTFFYDWRDGYQIARYKRSYMVYRPTDGEIRMYPKHYITDSHLLKSDHPTKLEECDDLPRGKPIVDGSLSRKFRLICK